MKHQTGLLVTLLLFFLVINLRESVEGTVIYVGRNGSNTTECLNGGAAHPCETLGYVLINLQCTNCTIVVSYDHKVFPRCGRYSFVHASHDVTMTNLVYLHIHGSNKPTLDFNNCGIKLIYDDNATELILTNLQIEHCQGASDHTTSIPTCISDAAKSNLKFLTKITLRDINVTDSYRIVISAHYNIQIQNINFYHWS